MIARREWYQRTEATWPAEVPPLTADEAVRAARKLYRFARGRAIRVPVVPTTGRIYTGFGVDTAKPFGSGRNVLKVNAEHGWKQLVHGLSHATGGGHSKGHARLEARMIREVLRRGWLDGALKTEPKPEPSQADRDARRLAQIEAGIARWQSKRKRAETALRKLERRRKYYAAKAVQS